MLGIAQRAQTVAHAKSRFPVAVSSSQGTRCLKEAAEERLDDTEDDHPQGTEQASAKSSL